MLRYYQWDTDIKLKVEGEAIEQVHFTNALTTTALVVEVKEGWANVPNIFLQQPYIIECYAVSNGLTIYREDIEVIKRDKPESYIYTETEVLSYTTLSERLREIEENGGSGTKGNDGGYYVPSVSSTGVLSWAATDDDMPAVATANIKGERGEKGLKGDTGEAGKDGIPATHSWNGTTLTVSSASGTTSANLKGEKGDKGERGEAGYTPVKGKDYFDGVKGNDGVSATHSWNGTTLTITSASGTSSANLKGEKGNDGYTPVKGKDYFDGVKGDTGEAGKDGVSASHSWNGTTLTITSASGTSSANLKGETGTKGDKGDTGSQGVSITSVKQTTTSTADAGNNVITVSLSNGTTSTFNVKNGSKGSQGEKGETGAKGDKGDTGAAGKTPVKGTDYYTAADKTEMKNSVIASLNTETWTFTLKDGSTVSKKVVLN